MDFDRSVFPNVRRVRAVELLSRQTHLRDLVIKAQVPPPRFIPDRRVPSDRNLQQLLSSRAELHDHRTGCIGRPDVAMRVDANRVRHGRQAPAPRPHHVDFAVENDDRVCLVPALQQIDQTFPIDRDQETIPISQPDGSCALIGMPWRAKRGECDVNARNAAACCSPPLSCARSENAQNRIVAKRMRDSLAPKDRALYR